MQNLSTRPPCTQRCENVRTCQQHSPAPLFSNNWLTPTCLCPATEVGFSGWTSRDWDMSSHQQCYSGVSYSRLTDPFSECLERVRKWKRLSYINATSIGSTFLYYWQIKQCHMDSILHIWRVEPHIRSSKPLWRWITCCASDLEVFQWDLERHGHIENSH